MPTGIDQQFREQRAKKSVQTERDRLLKRADEKVNVSKFLPSDGKDQARALVATSMLAGIGVTPYFVAVLMWMYVYHDSLAETICAVMGLLIGSALLCVGSTKRALGKDRPAMWWLGIICSQAVIVGTILGFVLYFRYLAYYWKYEEMRSYTNVAAAQSPAAFGDGSMFLFTEDTRVDPTRGVGYRSKWTGDTYCVAPIVDSTMNQGSDIYYWAVGKDCCNARGDFQCDDASDFTTRSGLVMLEPSDIVRSFMRWAVRGSPYEEYRDAISLQEAQYFTKASSEPKLVRWTRDPIAMRNSFYSEARSTFTWFSVFYVIFVTVCSYIISWKLIPAQRAEGLVRASPP